MTIAAQSASATILSLPTYSKGDNRNSIAVGASVGTIIERDAAYWGFTIDYGRAFDERWSGTVSLTFDRETESFSNQPDNVVDTYTVVGVLNYMLSDKWSITSGLGKGIADTDNDARELRFTSGDLSTGIAAGYTFSDRVGWSAAVEWNFSLSEASVSTDIAYRWDF